MIVNILRKEATIPGPDSLFVPGITVCEEIVVEKFYESSMSYFVF